MNYFISKPQQLHANIAESDQSYINLVPFEISTLVFFPSMDNEVSNIIRSLKKTGDLYQIPTQLFQLGSNYLAPLLSQFFNACIEDSIFPDDFKLSKITPLFKKGSRKIIENYRPISVLSNLNKIFEKLMYSRLSSFVQSFGILSSNQYGFRPDSNTELATLRLISRILPAISDKTYAIAVFVDFSAAFDTVTHDLLFSKLWRYGVRGAALDFVKSYFSGRSQEVTFNGCTSNRRAIDLGVLQGSILGPLFFNLYTNDINFLFDNTEIVLYADDGTLIFLSDDIDVLTLDVNSALAKLNDWCNYNRLAINSEKTKCMLITPKLNVLTPSIYLNQVPLEFVTSFKYLGVHLDNCLKLLKI